jgi:hypothetical protein
MPTIIRVKGYRLYFVSFDGSEPMHVHIRKGDRDAKVWLSPLSVAWSDFSAHDNRVMLEIVKENAGLIREKWHEHFAC